MASQADLDKVFKAVIAALEPQIAQVDAEPSPDALTASISISLKRIADAQEHQAISLKRLADANCPPLATPRSN